MIPRPSIRYLLVEDSSDDAALVLHALRQAGLSITGTRVENEIDFLREIQGPIDVVISDFRLPQFSGMLALELRNAHRPEVPFILVSGTIGEDLAVEAMRNGASDYLLKDRLARLGPAVLQAIEKAKLYIEREQNIEELRRAYDDLRRSQEAAMQQERLRALGQMASGVAHDINNAICVVGIYSELLLAREPNLSVEARDSLETIHRAIQDVGHTVGRLREFYRQREPQAKLVPVALNSLVDQIGALTRARWSDIPQRRGITIHFRVEPAAGLPDVPGIESEIREALTNLVFNAVDAMPTGGTLTIRTRLLQPEPGSSIFRVALEVSDTGVGMAEDTRRHCLEPFFTTKGERGTGLGLAMVVGIVQRHHAAIEIESAPGQGSTFRLIFDVPVATLAPLPADVATRPVTPRRILVVDDEEVIARAIAQVLQIDGHRVTAIHSGPEALELFRQALGEASPFQAVFTDLGMPEMDGTEVARHVKELAPGTPVIMLTGWGQGMIDDNTIPLHVDRVLSKPPRIAEIRAALAAFS